MTAPLTIALLWAWALVPLLGFTIFLIRYSAVARNFPELTRQSPRAANVSGRVSVLVAMKDEEQFVERCVRSILAQSYSDLEVVIALDRSRDGTEAVLRRLQEQAGDALQVVTIDDVPQGWGGQNHAFSKAAEVATGDWLLFADADCKLEHNDTISIAIAAAVNDDIELLTMIPQMEGLTLWEQIYLPLCGLAYLFGLELSDVNDPNKPAGFAFGPFMLFSRRGYDAMGGHHRVRSLINGDIAFGRIAKNEGIGYRAYGNVGLTSTRMYVTLPQAWSGWTRNFYNSIQRPHLLFGASLVCGVYFFGPFLGLAVTLFGTALTGLSWGISALFGLQIMLATGTHLHLCAATQLSKRGVFLLPAGALFMFLLCARSGVSALLRRPTTWHGVTYPAPVYLPPR